MCEACPGGEEILYPWCPVGAPIVAGKITREQRRVAMEMAMSVGRFVENVKMYDGAAKTVKRRELLEVPADEIEAYSFEFEWEIPTLG